MTRSLLSLSALALSAALFTTSQARADDTIKQPGGHPLYGVEAEPHALFGWDNIYPGNSFGLGGRFSIPVVDNGFIKTINNSVAISFGVDWLHYDSDCGRYANVYYYSCTANYLYFPVAMQWNFYVAERWSVFGEPGLYVYHGFFDTCPANTPPQFCVTPSSTTGIRPAFYAGGRFHFNEKISLTMRIGYPTFSIGVSWFL
jgi:hypothetical protein